MPGPYKVLSEPAAGSPGTWSSARRISAEKENARDGSPLKGKLDLDHVAVMGQSCGGFLSIALGADPRVKTIGVFNSGVQNARPESNGDALQKVHGPVLLINGAERDFLTPAALTTFELLKNVPVFYGARHGAGHTATVDPQP